MFSLQRVLCWKAILPLVCLFTVAVVSQPPTVAAHSSLSKGEVALQMPADQTFWYVTAQENFNDPNVQPIGVGATFGQYQPTLDPNDWGDTHSLAQLAVGNGGNGRDATGALELGWAVSKADYGDDKPHLFVYVRSTAQHFCEVKPDGQNWTCDFQLKGNPPIKPRDPVKVDALEAYAVEHYQGNWWIWYKDGYIGYIPDTHWEGTFTQITVAQWFGEVTSGSGKDTPCSQMGNSVLGSQEGSAVIDDMKYITYDGQTPIHAKAELIAEAKPFYDAGHFVSTDPNDKKTFHSFTYGGPGGCVA